MATGDQRPTIDNRSAITPDGRNAQKHALLRSQGTELVTLPITVSSMSGLIRSYRDLIVWQRAKDLARVSLHIRSALPRDLRFVVGDQILRSAWSVPSNIAEGRGRLSKADNVRHLTIARGSLEEFDSHIAMAVEFELLRAEDAAKAITLCSEIGRMLNAQIRKLGNRAL